MKKLKIILPTIALIVVLSLSVTIGVFAAMTSSLGVTSTVTFVTPTIDVIIDCYIGTDTSSEPVFSYPEDGEAWNITQFSFVTTAGSSDVEDAVLTFVITNNTEVPLYSYFTLSGSETKITQDTLDGLLTEGEGVDAVVVNKDIVNVSLEDEKQVLAKKGETPGTQTTSISFNLNNNIKVDDSALFNYALVLNKKSVA